MSTRLVEGSRSHITKVYHHVDVRSYISQERIVQNLNVVSVRAVHDTLLEIDLFMPVCIIQRLRLICIERRARDGLNRRLNFILAFCV